MSVVIDLYGGCADNACDPFVEKWRAWAMRSFATEHPALVETDSDYWSEIGGKSRNMVRKAVKKGYVFGSVAYNRYLDDIYEINTSLPVRGGRRMTKGYLDRPEPIRAMDVCMTHHTFYFGAYKNTDDGIEKLWAYCQLVQCGELGIISRILGHGDALKDGVMNGLVFNLVSYCRALGIPWVNYLTIESATEGLEHFKRSMAFESTPTTFLSSNPGRSK